MTPAPIGFLTSHSAPTSTQDSSWAKTGPMTVNVRNAVTSTVVRGVTNRSIISGTCLCSHFSSWHISQTAMMTGMTCP